MPFFSKGHFAAYLVKLLKTLHWLFFVKERRTWILEFESPPGLFKKKETLRHELWGFFFEFGTSSRNFGFLLNFGLLKRFIAHLAPINWRQNLSGPADHPKTKHLLALYLYVLVAAA